MEQRMLITLSDQDSVATATFEVTGHDVMESVAGEVLKLYEETNPAPFRRSDLMVEIDRSLSVENAGKVELMFSRARFASHPKRSDAKPRWGRWHRLTVEAVPCES